MVDNVGIANDFGGQSLENVYVLAPLALFEATRLHCRAQKSSAKDSAVARVIQISTIGVDWPDCDKFPYAASKLRLEEQLAGLGELAHVIIRPNVIYEPQRGHLLLEQIAKIPILFYIGHEQIQPVHCREIAIGVVRILMRETVRAHSILRAVGPVARPGKRFLRSRLQRLGNDISAIVRYR